jgi:PleD family two-component response regulator
MRLGANSRRAAVPDAFSVELMLSRVAVVHKKSELLNALSGGLTQAGYAVARFTDPMAALRTLETTHFKLLITPIEFDQPETMQGVTLARMAKYKHREVLFVARPEMRAFYGGVGELLETSASIRDVLDAAKQLLPP